MYEEKIIWAILVLFAMSFMSACNEPTQSPIPISESTPTSEASTPTPVVKPTPTPDELKPLIFQKSTDTNFINEENKTCYVGAVIVTEGEDPSAYMETDRLMLRRFIIPATITHIEYRVFYMNEITKNGFIIINNMLCMAEDYGDVIIPDGITKIVEDLGQAEITRLLLNW